MPKTDRRRFLARTTAAAAVLGLPFAGCTPRTPRDPCPPCGMGRALPPARRFLRFLGSPAAVMANEARE